MLGSLLKEMGPHDWQPLSWTSWVFLTFTSPQVRSGADCHLSSSGGKQCRLSPLQKDERAFIHLSHGTSELVLEVVELEVEILFLFLLCESRVSVSDWLSSSPLKPDSMVRLWKIIAKISPKRRTEHDSFKFNVSQATVEEGEQCVEVLHGLLFISPIEHRWPAKSIWTLRSALLIHLEEPKHPHRVHTPELGCKQNPE